MTSMWFLGILVSLVAGCQRAHPAKSAKSDAKPVDTLHADSETAASLLEESESWASALFLAPFFGVVVVDRIVEELCTGAGGIYMEVHVEYVAGGGNAPQRLLYGGHGHSPKAKVGDRLLVAFNSAARNAHAADPQCLQGGFPAVGGSVLWAEATLSRAEAEQAADRFYRIRSRVRRLRGLPPITAH